MWTRQQYNKKVANICLIYNIYTFRNFPNILSCVCLRYANIGTKWRTASNNCNIQHMTLLHCSVREGEAKQHYFSPAYALNFDMKIDSPTFPNSSVGDCFLSAAPHQSTFSSNSTCAEYSCSVLSGSVECKQGICQNLLWVIVIKMVRIKFWFA